MAKYDVYKHPDGDRYILDVQTDLMDDFDTRVIVPLVALDLAPKIAKRLNPIFTIEGVQMSMVTQFIATVPKAMLKTPITNLNSEFDKITQALDMVFQGF